jgi:hypothetical protein
VTAARAVEVERCIAFDVAELKAFVLKIAMRSTIAVLPQTLVPSQNPSGKNTAKLPSYR